MTDINILDEKATLDLIRANRGKHYVYGLIRPDDVPFYIGEGQNKRILVHFKKSEYWRNWKKADVIRAIIAAGNSIRFCLFGFYDTREQTIAVERKLIAHYGRDVDGGPLTNLMDGATAPLRLSEAGTERKRRATQACWRNPEWRAAVLAKKAKADLDPIVIERRRNAQLGRKNTEAFCEAKRQAALKQHADKPHSETTRTKIGEALRQKWADPDWKTNHKKRLSEGQKRAWATGKFANRSIEESSKKHGEAMRRLWKEGAYKMRPAPNEATRAKSSEARRRAWKEGVYSAPSEATRAKLSEAVRKSWVKRHEDNLKNTPDLFDTMDDQS